MKTSDAVPRPLIGAAAVLILVLALGRVLTIPARIPLSYNEGWNGYLAVRAVFAAGGPLYPPPGGLITNNYPPLSFYVVGLLGRFVFGDMIIAGRVVALLSLFGSAALLGLCVVRLGSGKRTACMVAMLLLLFACTFYRDYVAMDDPQWLAHAVMLGGLATLLRSRSAKRLPASDVIAAALLMLAGGFVKHNLIGLPITVTIWLACFNRDACLVWVITGAAGLCLGAGLAYTCYGPDFFVDVLHAPRILRFARLPQVFPTLIPLIPMGVVAFAPLRRPRLDPAIAFAALFVVIAAVTGLTQRLGEGVNYNAYFETMIATCLALGVALSRVPDSRRLGALLMVLIAVLPVLVTLPGHARTAWGEIADRHARQTQWRPIIGQISSTHGSALCETLALCYWAEKPFTVDMFNLNQAILTGRIATPDLRHFAIVEYQLQSSIHTDAIRQLGSDPLMDQFVGQCSGLIRAPHGLMLIQPPAHPPRSR
jgi:hypothetical protein